jgi:hypothetical protein
MLLDANIINAQSECPSNWRQLTTYKVVVHTGYKRNGLCASAYKATNAAHLLGCLCSVAQSVRACHRARVSSHQLRACSPLRDHRSAMPPRRRRLVRQGPALGRLGSTPPTSSVCCASNWASGGAPAAPLAAVHAPAAAALAARAPTLPAADAGATAAAVAGAGAPAATAAGYSRASRRCFAPKARCRHRQESCCVPAVACCPGGGIACCGCCCGGGCAAAAAAGGGGAPTMLQPRWRCLQLLF